MALNSSRFILNKEKINFEMINYFYSKDLKEKIEMLIYLCVIILIKNN